jgi:acetyl esterase
MREVHASVRQKRRDSADAEQSSQSPRSRSWHTVHAHMTALVAHLRPILARTPLIGRLFQTASQGIVTVPPSAFCTAAIPTSIATLNAKLEAGAKGTPYMCDGTAQEARLARSKLFKHEPRREDITIPGLQAGSDPEVGLSIFRPASGRPRAAYLQIHGGSFIFGSAFGQNDERLQRMADELHIAVVSVDYRLSPEAAFPLPVDDCVAAALWLAEQGPAVLGTDLYTVGGESAGGHLCVSMLLRLRELASQRGIAGDHLAPATLFRCVNLVYGWYDLGGSPSNLGFRPRRLVLSAEDLEWAAKLFVPDDALRTRRAGPEAGGASPLYSHLGGMPPALFTVGSDDPLRDDTLFMAARWAAHGIDAELEVYPGAAHVRGIPIGLDHSCPHLLPISCASLAHLP